MGVAWWCWWGGRGGDEEEWRASVEKRLKTNKQNDTLADKRRARAETNGGDGEGNWVRYCRAARDQKTEQAHMNKTRKEREAERHTKMSFPTESLESGGVSVNESDGGGDGGPRRRRKQGKSSKNKEKPLRAG